MVVLCIWQRRCRNTSQFEKASTFMLLLADYAESSAQLCTTHSWRVDLTRVAKSAFTTTKEALQLSSTPHAGCIEPCQERAGVAAANVAVRRQGLCGSSARMWWRVTGWQRVAIGRICMPTAEHANMQELTKSRTWTNWHSKLIDAFVELSSACFGSWCMIAQAVHHRFSPRTCLSICVT